MTLQFKKKDVDLDNVIRIIRATDPAVYLRNPHTEPGVPEQVRALAQLAAVAMLIVDKPNPTVIFTRRHPGIRFGGQYCFPGGKADSGNRPPRNPRGNRGNCQWLPDDRQSRSILHPDRILYYTLRWYSDPGLYGSAESS